MENWKIKKLNEQNIILSRDCLFVSIAAAVALKRQSTWASSKEKSEKGKLKKQTNKILFCHVTAAVALKRQSTWDLSRKNWKKEN